jgi:hypothetical protein
MRHLLDLVEAATNTAKLDRSAFLYLPPKPPADQFADCSSCRHFIPDEKKCSIFAAEDRVEPDGSCGLYLHGTPSNDQECLAIVTPEQAGYVQGPVRCGHCSWYDDHQCGLYQTLMQKLPDVFELETSVDPHACCNAWQKG